MATFPAITPTAMDFTAPEFPVRSNTSLSGVVSRRLFGNRGSKSSLNLSFDNIGDVIAAQILTAWNSGQGQLDALIVPDEVFDGAGTGLLAYLSEGGDELIWHFASPPQVQRVAPGISSVRVTLEATRDA
jgi:hypothetical protein